MRKYLQGIEGASPQLVGLARGLVEVVILAGLAFLGMNLDAIFGGFHLSATQTVLASPVAFGAIRWAEGWVDGHIDPTQNRTPPTVGGI